MPRLFIPVLPGATLPDRLLACFGALAGICLTGIVCALLCGTTPQGRHLLPFLVAPMGASAVLLFAVPASPLAQPWAIIGGNSLSALCGMVAAALVPDPLLATGVGVGLAIAVMSLTRSLHPPGGAAALTAVLGGPMVEHWGWWFPLVPVALNGCLLVGVGMLHHKLSRRHAYPHAAPAARPASMPRVVLGSFQKEDVDAALKAMHETFDIDREDLETLLREIESQAMRRMREAPMLKAA